MKITPKIPILIFFISLFSLQHTWSQNTSGNQYIWFDAILGVENTGIYSGIEYKEKYRTINEKHKFFLSPNFLKGSITYNGQSYYNIDLKYDVYEDMLLAKIKNKTGGDVILQLMKGKVTAFDLNNHHFINLVHKEMELEVYSGFYEILEANNTFVFYKKNEKIKKDRLDKSTVYSEFNTKDSYLLHYNESYYSIKSKRNIIQVFPGLKKEINVFHNSNEVLLVSKKDDYMIALMKRISKLLAQNNAVSK
jgi:hypothetical protein